MASVPSDDVRDAYRGARMTVEAFLLGTTIVLIQDYGDGNGWQAFTPTTDDGRIDTTLDAIAARAGVERTVPTDKKE